MGLTRSNEETSNEPLKEAFNEQKHVKLNNLPEFRNHALRTVALLFRFNFTGFEFD